MENFNGEMETLAEEAQQLQVRSPCKLDCSYRRAGTRSSVLLKMSVLHCEIVALHVGDLSLHRALAERAHIH